MKWVTREHPKTDRIACPWLIRTFIDPAAEIVYLPADQVLAFAEREGAISFDATSARYTHRDGLCSFEVLVEEYRLSSDPALALVARVIHGADVSGDRDVTPPYRARRAHDGTVAVALERGRIVEARLQQCGAHVGRRPRTPPPRFRRPEGRRPRQSRRMIPKSGNRFSDKIMRKKV